MDGVKILTWHCNGLTNEKQCNEDFVNILREHDIFLLESWTNDKSNIDLSGYTSHNFYLQTSA